MTVAPSSPTGDDVFAKDFRFTSLEKDNAPIKKETERLVMTTKDTGKMFSSDPTSTSGTDAKTLARERALLDCNRGYSGYCC